MKEEDKIRIIKKFDIVYNDENLKFEDYCKSVFNNDGFMEAYMDIMKTFNKYHEHKIKKIDNKSISILYNWLCTNFQDDLVIEKIINFKDNIVCIFSQYENDRDFDIYFDAILKYICNYYEKNSLRYIKRSKLKKLSSEQSDNLVIKFFNRIDKTGELTKIYIDTIKDGKIMYADEIDELGLRGVIYEDTHCNTYYGDPYILINSDYNYMDVINKVHEFMHYLKMVTLNEGKVPLANETFSIYFERLCMEYLKRLKLSEEEFDSLKVDRIIDVRNIWNKIKDKAILLNKYLNTDDITKDDLKGLDSKKILQCSDEFFMDAMPYLLGYIVSEETVKSEKANEIVSNMLYCVKNMNKIGMKDVFDSALIKLDYKKAYTKRKKK